MTETQVADQPSTPPLLVRLHEDIVIVADAISGIRAWSLKGEDRLVASAILNRAKPTSLAIDDTVSSSEEFNISTGFDDGSFEIYTLGKMQRTLTLRYTHAPSTNGTIHAIAYASPYLLTMTGEPLLSLYRFIDGYCDNPRITSISPVLLSSMRSHTAYPPLSLAIRVSSTTIVASIAYAMPTWTQGWSVGLQELRLTAEGTTLDSRMASAPIKVLPNRLMRSSLTSLALAGLRTPAPPKPTSLSYTHPYLLSAHADNTLTLYMVTSNSEELSIGAGNRLWGHTSSVSGAHVGDRGKAVSVSTHGNELRVWELEGGLVSSASRRRAAAGEVSIQVRPDKRGIETRRDPYGAYNKVTIPIASGRAQDHEDMNLTKGWVAFDDEKVVLLREKLKGGQALVVYDFS